MVGEKRQITRNRASYSCQKCRQRKVKCDKVHPVCGSCQKSGEECVYASVESDARPDSISQNDEPSSAKKRKQSVAELQTDHDGLDEPSHPTEDLDSQLLKLSVLLNQLSNIAGVSTNTQSSLPNTNGTGHLLNDFLTPESQLSTCDNRVSQTERMGRRQPSAAPELGQTIGKGALPNLDSISAQLEQLTSLLRVQQSGSDAHSVAGRFTAQPLDSSIEPLVADADAALFVPNESQRNALFRCWLSSVYPVLPIVAPHHALLYYRTFHFWYTYGLEKGIPNPCEDHVPLIYAIYYAGMMSMSLRGIRKWFPGLPRRNLLETSQKQFFQSLRAPNKILSNPAVLAARVMMYYLSPPETTNVGLASTAAALVRAAYSCNLHRERPNEPLAKETAEVRRRLWAEIVALDTLESTASNMPPSVNHHYCDTSIPNELKDVKLDTDEAIQYEKELRQGRLPDSADDPVGSSKSSMISVVYLFMKARISMAAHARKLVNINLAAKPKTKEDMMDIRRTLDEMDRYVKSNIGRIPTKGVPELDFTPPTSRPGQSVSTDYANLWGDDLISVEVDVVSGTTVQAEPTELPYIQQYRNSMNAFHKWARIVLSMSVDQLKCFSYAPFHSNAKRKLWLSARQCALRSAHSCLRKFIALASDLELERFRWTWPGMYQPIHAGIIVLLDTYERPNSREAPRSRALFDQMLSLSSPEHGIVGSRDGLTSKRPLQESGHEAFVMLMQLRAKAWQIAGLDPHLLWTEQDQIDVGVATPLTEAEKMAQSMREDTVYNSATADRRDGQSGSHLLRASIEQRAGEYFHPSQGPVPDDTDDSMTYTQEISQLLPDNPQTQRLLRARPDQQRTPDISLQNTRNLPTESGHIYRFKLPSELYDINQLIDRIRSVQRSTDPDTVEDTTHLSQQVATANNDLTKYLAQKFPDVHTIRPGTATNRSSGAVASGHVPYSSTTKPNHIHVSEQATSMNGASSSTSTSSTSSSFSSPPPTTTTNTASKANPIPSSDPTFNDNNSVPTATAPDRASAPASDPMTIDFDWAKWDQVFGHIMDDGFAGLDSDLDVDTAMAAVWAD